MATTSYYTIDGQIIGEATGGARTGYLPDALGSVTATASEAGAVVNTYRYKPYGAQLSKAGVGADPRFQWIGETGYRIADLLHYIRARHYLPTAGSWISVDQLWFDSQSYGYVGQNPSTQVDPTGHYPIPKDCNSLPTSSSDVLSRCLRSLCLAFINPHQQREIRKCLAQQGIKVYDLLSCWMNFCKNGSVKCDDNCSPRDITCLQLTDYFYRRCPYSESYTCEAKGIPPCGFTSCGKNEFDAGAAITICTWWWTGGFSKLCTCPSEPGRTCGQDPGYTVLHEFAHVCGQCSDLDPDLHQNAFDEAAKCIRRVIGC